MTELRKSWTPSASGLRRWRSYTQAHSAPLRPLGSQGAYSARSSCISRSAWARCSSTDRSRRAHRSSISCWRASCCHVNASVMSKSAIGTMSSCIQSQSVFPPNSLSVHALLWRVGCCRSLRHVRLRVSSSLRVRPFPTRDLYRRGCCQAGRTIADRRCSARSSLRRAFG
jgi:hypothetical protein